MNGKRGVAMGKTPGKGTFAVGEGGAGKVPLGGRIVKGKGDLRNGKGSNAGKMPKTV